MSFTVGKLEDMLRQFPKGTEIYHDCGNCHHGSNADIKVNDRTNQTYGYIELVLNDRKDPKVECAANEKQWYEKEIERLNMTIKDLESKIENYKYTFDRIKTQVEWFEG